MELKTIWSCGCSEIGREPPDHKTQDDAEMCDCYAGNKDLCADWPPMQFWQCPACHTWTPDSRDGAWACCRRSRKEKESANVERDQTASD